MAAVCPPLMRLADNNDFSSDGDDDDVSSTKQPGGDPRSFYFNEGNVKHFKPGDRKLRKEGITETNS